MWYGALEMGPVPSSSSIPKSTSRDGGILGRSSGKTSINSFTLWVLYLLVFSFLLCLLHRLETPTPPCCTRRLAFIIDIIFGVVPVKVPLNLKGKSIWRCEYHLFLWQSMLAKFLASQFIPSMTSKSVISNTFKSTWMVCPAITTCPPFTLFFVTRSTPAGYRPTIRALRVLTKFMIYL